VSNQTSSDQFSQYNPKGYVAHGDYVIVFVGTPTTVSKGGIHLPRAVLDVEPGTGIVVSIGRNVDDISLEDRIVWKDTAVLHNGKPVANESGVFLDNDRTLVAIKKDMIIAVRRDAGAA